MANGASDRGPGEVCFQPVCGRELERQRYYTSQLCEMRNGLSPSVRDMLPDRSMSELAAALVDGTVFEIVKELEVLIISYQRTKLYINN